MHPAEHLYLGLANTSINGSYGTTTFVLDQSNDQVAWIFKADDDITITELGFRASAKNGNGTFWQISLQEPRPANGIPSGLPLGGSTPASGNFNNDNVSTANFNWITLANPYTCVAGQDLAIVIEYCSGTTPSVGVDDLTIMQRGSFYGGSQNPYTATNSAGAGWSKVTTNNGIYGYQSSFGQKYGNPIRGGTTTNHNNTSNPPIRGFFFILPAEWGNTYYVLGVDWIGSQNSGGSGTIDLYQGSEGTGILQTLTYNGNIDVAFGVNQRTHYFEQSNLTPLKCGEKYYIGFKPQNSTNINLRGHEVTTRSEWLAFPFGTGLGNATRNGGVWSEQPLERLSVALVVSGISPSAIGGYSVHGNVFQDGIFH